MNEIMPTIFFPMLQFPHSNPKGFARDIHRRDPQRRYLAHVFGQRALMQRLLSGDIPDLDPAA